jgi:hypothetical protein
MLSKHFYSLIACCTIAAAIIFSAFTPSSSNLTNQVKKTTKTVAKTDPNAVECGCTFSSGGCADCTCVGGFATGCSATSNLRDGGKPAPIAIEMSANQLRQALKYQRFLLSLDSPESVAAAVQVSQLIEAIQDGKTANYQQIAEQYQKTFDRLPKGEKEIVCNWVDNKKKILKKTLEELEMVELPEKMDKN